MEGLGVYLGLLLLIYLFTVSCHLLDHLISSSEENHTKGVISCLQKLFCLSAFVCSGLLLLVFVSARVSMPCF